MDCQCLICHGRDLNKAGMELADQEIIPFVKRELLKLRYPDHPLPLKYKGLLASLLCYGQALAHTRAHNETSIYYTDNEWMLKFCGQLMEKFGMAIMHSMNVPKEHRLVCEFNTEAQNERQD